MAAESTEQVIEGQGNEPIWDEEGDGEEWVEEEEFVVEEVVEEIEENVEDVINVQIDEENDLNEADFDDDDEFGDEFEDDEDAGGWDDDDEMDVDSANPNTGDGAVPTFVSSLVGDSATPQKALPQETKEAINRNSDEINMLPMFSCVPDLNAPAVMIGIKIKQFRGISRDQLAVWGLAGYTLSFGSPCIFRYPFTLNSRDKSQCVFVHSDYQYIAIRLKLGRYSIH